MKNDVININCDSKELQNIDNLLSVNKEELIYTKEDSKIELNEEKKDENKDFDNIIDYDTLVLSGGSTKGIILLGALQYLYDNYLLNNIKYYIGTSAGSIICYLLAIGYTPIEIIVYICKNQLMEKMQHFNIVAMINGSGAISFNNIHEHLEKMTIEKIGYLPTILDLKNNFDKNFICATYNISEEKVEYISTDNYPNLPCLIAIRMSSNLPLIFENYKYGNSYYVDGGIADNFPIDIADNLGKKVLGIVFTSKKENFNYDHESSILEFIYKIMFIPVSKITEDKILKVSKNCKIIKITYDKIKFFNFNISSKTKLDLFSIGYEEMKKNIEF